MTVFKEMFWHSFSVALAMLLAEIIREFDNKKKSTIFFERYVFFYFVSDDQVVINNGLLKIVQIFSL